MNRYIFLSIITLDLLYSSTFSWGSPSKIGLLNDDVANIIKQAVIKKYPQKVKAYHKYLKELRAAKLKSIKNIVFLKDNLLWQDNNTTETLRLNSLEAKNYCKTLNFATKNDWRLPTYNELLTLVNYYRYNPAKLDGLKYVASGSYWTSTQDIKDISSNWYIDFTFGQTGRTLKYRKNFVRCVRDLSNVEGDF